MPVAATRKPANRSSSSPIKRRMVFLLEWETLKAEFPLTVSVGDVKGLYGSGIRRNRSTRGWKAIGYRGTRRFEISSQDRMTDCVAGIWLEYDIQNRKIKVHARRLKKEPKKCQNVS